MDIRIRSAARSWTVCKYMYISEVNIRSLRRPCRESNALSTYQRCARWSGRGFLSDAAARTITPDCKKHRSSPHPGHPHAATRYKLTPQQSIPTTNYSAVVRESQCGQVWQFLGAYNRSRHVGCLAVAGSLTYHTVWSQSGRSSTLPVASFELHLFSISMQAPDPSSRPWAD